MCRLPPLLLALALAACGRHDDASVTVEGVGPPPESPTLAPDATLQPDAGQAPAATVQPDPALQPDATLQPQGAPEDTLAPGPR